MPSEIEETLKTVTRLLVNSETNRRLPDESKAKPSGLFMPACVVAAEAVVNSDWPRTLEAAMPLVIEATLKTVTRLLVRSATKRRLPAESWARWKGLLILQAFGAVVQPPPKVVLLAVAEVKFGWPRTKDAFMPFDNEAVS